MELEAAIKPILNFSSGQPVCERTAIADRPLQRMKGLLGRKSLAGGEGLLLRPAPSIHTAFMRFPIDAVFLDADMRVMKIVEPMRPWRVAGKRGAKAVLELAAGEASRRGVAVGDRLVVSDDDDRLVMPGGDFTTSNGGDGDDGNEYGVGAVLAQDFLPNPELVASIHDGTQRSLRVLVIAHDRRYRSVASALLARRGCVVASGPSANRIVELIARERADVVVIDAGALLTAAARTVATVAAIEPPVGVVLVDDEAETGLEHMPVLAKWGSFEEFFAAIEQADRERGRRSRLVG
jgi:uncharacterized membrane protein (UPF0127 family)/CheY-like chemotaxis protein